MPANGFPVAAWDAVILSYVKALRVRRLAFEAGALFAGRMPMTSCFIGGGVTDSGTEDLTAKCNKFKQVMQEVGAFVVQEYVPIALALGALYPRWDNANNGGSGYGAGLGRFLAWGAYPDARHATRLLSAGGYYDAAARRQLHCHQQGAGLRDVAGWRHASRADQPHRVDRPFALRHLLGRRCGLHR